jgi:hypothetical protein
MTVLTGFYGFNRSNNSVLTTAKLDEAHADGEMADSKLPSAFFSPHCPA